MLIDLSKLYAILFSTLFSLLDLSVKDTTDLHEDVYRNGLNICILSNTLAKIVWIDMIFNFFSAADNFSFPENGRWMYSITRGTLQFHSSSKEIMF